MSEMKELVPMTIEEFETIIKDERLCYELIDGIVAMSPSPSFQHQAIGSRVVANASIQLKGVCTAVYEYDMKVDKYNVYRPDVAIYCKGKEEIPEIVFEILSASTKQRDLMVKPARYNVAGVKEYWIIDPESHTVIVHTFAVDDTDEINIYNANAIIRSKVIPEFVVKASELFEENA